VEEEEALRNWMTAACLIALAAAAAPPVAADEPQHLTLTIRNHRFEPAQIEVPAGTRFRLWVKNADPSLEEFESFDLHREKLVPPGKEIYVFLGPLDKGEYKFFGDFHQDTAQGVMIAK
jgi:plastocyanin domain-containing protein